MRRPRIGFTFVELLMAMTVLGVLSAVAVPRYRSFKERAYLAAMRTELGSLRVAEEAYWTENMAYSADTSSLDWNGSGHITLKISSLDLSSGYTAVASHSSAPSLQCATSVGRDASTAASGDIVCTTLGSSTGTGITP